MSRTRRMRWAAPLVTGGAGGPLFAFVATQSSPYLGAVVMAGLLVSGAIALWPFLGFAITAFVVPLERIGRITDDASTYTFSLMRIVGILTVGSLLIHALVQRRRLVVSAPLVLYGVYVGLGMVTLLFTTDPDSGVRTASMMLGNILFFFLVTNIVKTGMHARIAMICWLCSTVGIGLFTVYQWHNPSATVVQDFVGATGELTTDERFATVIYDGSEHESLGRTARALGSTSSPAVYGINLLLTLPFFAYFARTERRPWALGLVAAGATVVVYNVLLTNTRAAILTLGVTAVCLVATRLIRIRPAGLVAAALVGVLSLAMAPQALYDRVFALSNYTLEGSQTLRARLAYWQEALQVVRENPVLGVGLGNQSVIPKRLSRRMDMPPNSSVHNEYLYTAMETGVAGTFVMLAFLATLYRRCRTVERSVDPDVRWIGVAGRVALMTVLFYALQVDVLHFPLKGWWMAMGVVTALAAFVPPATHGRMAPLEAADA